MADALVCHHSFWLFLRPAPVLFCIFLVLGCPELAAALWMEPHHFWGEGKDHLLHPTASTVSNTAQDAVDIFCWNITVQLVVGRTPALFLPSWFPAPRAHWCTGLFLPRSRTLLSVLNLVRSLSALFSRGIQRSLWMPVQPSGLSATPPSFVVSANLLRMCVALSSRSFLKLLNSLAPVSNLEAHHWWLASSWTLHW